jgi:hypothetical protein
MNAIVYLHRFEYQQSEALYSFASIEQSSKQAESQLPLAQH